MPELTPKILLEGLKFPEGPRWRDDRLWFSDMPTRRVMTVDLSGHTQEITRLECKPSGLGFLPDGTSLVVSMEDHKLYRLDGGSLTLVADCSSLCGGEMNDMVVDSQGRAYIGNSGFPMGGVFKPANLIRVDPDGTVSLAAPNMKLPNGSAITDDGKTLIVAESRGERLTAFDIAGDGSLANRRTFAEMPGQVPDGICLDAGGGVWVGLPLGKEFQRVLEGGEVTHRIPTPDRYAVAVALGGPDRRTLFLLTSETSGQDPEREHAIGRIETVQVETPGAGLP